MKKFEKPEGNGCYILHMFGESTVCPDLDAEVSMGPKCRKYDVELGWTVSGRVLKCTECLESEVQGAKVQRV